MTKKLLQSLGIFILTLFTANFVFAQGYTPMRGGAFKAYPLQNGLVCLGCASGNINNVIDANLDNYANMGNLLSAIGGNGISVSNSNTVYPAGYVTGFNVDLGNNPITASLLSSTTVATYLNGVLQESAASSTLLSVPAFGGQKSRIFLQFKTTRPFNEVRLYKSNGIALFDALNVYYAFAFDPNAMVNENNGICDDLIGGSTADVDNNVSSSSSFIAPLSYLVDRKNITDGDKNSFAQILMPAGLLGSYSVGVLDKNQIYPAGNNAGFVISPQDQNTIFNLQTLSSITIETYLFGQLQDSQAYSNSNGLINLTVLSFGSNKQKLSVKTTKPFNEIRLKVTQLAGVNLGTIKVYYAFEEPQNCDCKQYLQTDKAAPYNGKLVTGNLPNGASSFLGLLGREQWTGVWNIFSGNITASNMSNTGNVVDANSGNASSFTVFPLTVGTQGSVTAEGDGTTYPAGTTAGFIIDKSGVLTDWSILSSINLQLYNGNTLVQSESNANNGLASIKFITSNTGKTVVAIKSKFPFNRIRISIKQGISLNLGQTYNIFNAFVEGDEDGDGTPDCYDRCPNGNDAMDTDGDGIPDACDDTNCLVSDKSSILDYDKDGITDACDIDSDNDGIPDNLEDGANRDSLYENDDLEGNELYSKPLGDGISNYKDFDSDNDGVLDLFESGIPTSIIDQIDANHNGIIDSNVAVGKNGLANILETFPDSGILKYPIKDTDGDGTPDFLDLTSNGTDFDLYVIGKAGLDTAGGRTPTGYIYPVSDADKDGIMDTANPVVDTDLVNHGAPGSPLSPYAIAARGGSNISKITVVDAVVANDVKIYPNPVKTGENINISLMGNVESQYSVYSAQGQLVKTGKFTGAGEINTASLVTGVYIIKVQTENFVKSYKIIVQ